MGRMILIAGQIESLNSRKDKTIKLSIGTQELTPSEAADIFSLTQSFVYLAIKKEHFQSSELEDLESLKTDFENQKTPGQRLRGVLYINYEKNSEGFKDFTTYYQSKMEAIIGHFKSKLD